MPDRTDVDPARPEPAEIELQRSLLPGLIQRQFEYGKWLLASLLAVHLGSLFVISQSGEQAPALFAASGPPLVYGVGTALLCGGLAWINFTCAAWIQSNRVQAMVNGFNYEPHWGLRWTVHATFFGTPFLALVSLLLFFAAAHWALGTLQP